MLITSFGGPAVTGDGLLEHFEGKDWITSLLSVAAILVSVVAVLYNRRANRMNEIAQPARFVATWHSHVDPMRQPAILFVLENKGLAAAERLSVMMPYDPSHILGLAGTVRELVKPGETAEFSLRSPDFQERTMTSPYDVVLTWFDVWGKPRSQWIAGKDAAWSTPIEDGKSDHLPSQPSDMSGLYDIAPWWHRLMGRPRWKLRRERMPRYDRDYQ